MSPARAIGMNRIALIAFIVLALLCGLMDQGFAQDRTVRVAGVDIRPLIEYMRSGVEVLKQPIHVYSYSDGGAGLGRQAFSAHDPLGYVRFKRGARSYWASQGNESGGNVLGIGLYAALDPVHTRSYGALDWVLTRIELPKGARFLRVKAGGPSVPNSVVDLTNKLGCIFTSQHDWNPRNLTSLEVLMGPKEGSSPQCLEAIQHAARTVLKIDALLYDYLSVHLSECAANSERQSAFVIIDDRRIPEKNVRLFNHLTVDEKPERLRIESLFYKASVDAQSEEGALSALRSEWAYKILPLRNPGRMVTGIGLVPESNPAKYTFHLCPIGTTDFDSPGCFVVPEPALPSLAYPTKISLEAPAILSSSRPEEPWRLRFADLDGEMTDPQIGNWITKNLYGCSAVPQTEKLK